ncbi:hypothetical protein BDV10DRAFT_181922 [Aspergillus recurvatus]
MAAINNDSLRQMHLDVAADQAVNNAPIHTLLDLQIFLSEWVTEKGESREFVGNIHPLAELLRTVALLERQTLLAILEHVYTAYAAAKEDPGFHDRHYAPLPPTLATYMMGEMVRSPQVIERMDEERRTRHGDELLRYKIRVIRNSFIWLDELMRARGEWLENWIGEKDVQAEHRVTMWLRWLTRSQTRRFCEEPGEARQLTEGEKADLEDFWLMFERNEWLPIQFAFCLARLDPDGSWGGGWSGLYEIIEPLL